MRLLSSLIHIPDTTTGCMTIACCPLCVTMATGTTGTRGTVITGTCTYCCCPCPCCCCCICGCDSPRDNAGGLTLEFAPRDPSLLRVLELSPRRPEPPSKLEPLPPLC